MKNVIFILILLISSCSTKMDIEKFANKLFNHYEYDDKINKYLKSFFSFGNSKSKTWLETKQNIPSNNTQTIHHSFKIKSKKKMIYSFGDGQSLQMNPSNIQDKIIYNQTPFSYFEFKKDSILYGIKIDFWQNNS